MSNYNKQQQAVILKGIAQQILSMNVPSFDEVDKLFQQFNQVLYPKDVISELCEKEQKFNSMNMLIDDIKDTLLNSRGDDSLVSWINDRLEEL
jgi:hypothetical protein